MQKILKQAKHIVIFILLLTVVPLGFVKGFFAYLDYVGDAEIAVLLNKTGEVYDKLCLDAAILSFICTYVMAYFIKKKWLKVLLIAISYIVLFFVWQFVLISILGHN